MVRTRGNPGGSRIRGRMSEEEDRRKRLERERLEQEQEQEQSEYDYDYDDSDFYEQINYDDVDDQEQNQEQSDDDSVDVYDQEQINYDDVDDQEQNDDDSVDVYDQEQINYDDVDDPVINQPEVIDVDKTNKTNKKTPIKDNERRRQFELFLKKNENKSYVSSPDEDWFIPDDFTINGKFNRYRNQRESIYSYFDITPFAYNNPPRPMNDIKPFIINYKQDNPEISLETIINDLHDHKQATGKNPSKAFGMSDRHKVYPIVKRALSHDRSGIKAFLKQYVSKHSSPYNLKHMEKELHEKRDIYAIGLGNKDPRNNILKEFIQKANLNMDTDKNMYNTNTNNNTTTTTNNNNNNTRKTIAKLTKEERLDHEIEKNKESIRTLAQDIYIGKKSKGENMNVDQLSVALQKRLGYSRFPPILIDIAYKTINKIEDGIISQGNEENEKYLFDMAIDIIKEYPSESSIYQLTQKLASRVSASHSRASLRRILESAKTSLEREREIRRYRKGLPEDNKLIIPKEFLLPRKKQRDTKVIINTIFFAMLFMFGIVIGSFATSVLVEDVGKNIGKVVVFVVGVFIAYQIIFPETIRSLIWQIT